MTTRNLADYAPYRSSSPSTVLDEATCSIEGTLPDYLRGGLFRTAPAIFKGAKFAVDHLFDGLGLIYAFELEPGRARYKQRLLASETRRDLLEGRYEIGHFGTDSRRPLLQRILKPIPKITDNTNVHIVPISEDALLAMTESPKQHLIDPETLESRGLFQYDDRLPSAMVMTAHPAYERASRSIVNVATKFGPRSELLVYRQPLGSKRREIIARFGTFNPPYIHSFGFSGRDVVIFDHSLKISPIRMLFSNRSFKKAFVHSGKKESALLRIDLETGRTLRYPTEDYFCFHVVNQFESGDELIVDLIGFDAPSIVDALSVDRLLDGYPTLGARYLRARLSRDAHPVKFERLFSERLEFPGLDRSRREGARHLLAFGASMTSDESGRPSSTLVQLNLETGETRHHHDPDYFYGEPIFVADPSEEKEGAGVILSVGGHLEEERSSLIVLDAQRFEPIAKAIVDRSIPLGFHGSFRRA